MVDVVNQLSLYAHTRQLSVNLELPSPSPLALKLTAIEDFISISLASDELRKAKYRNCHIVWYSCV